MEDTVPRSIGIGLCCLAVPLIAGAVALLVFMLSRARPRQVARPRPRRTTDYPEVLPATRPSRCPECGALLPNDAPEGLCPQCLLKGVISSAHEAAKSAPANATAAYGEASAP